MIRISVNAYIIRLKKPANWSTNTFIACKDLECKGPQSLLAFAHFSKSLNYFERDWINLTRDAVRILVPVCTAAIFKEFIK